MTWPVRRLRPIRRNCPASLFAEPSPSDKLRPAGEGRSAVRSAADNGCNPSLPDLHGNSSRVCNAAVPDVEVGAAYVSVRPEAAYRNLRA